MALLPLFLLLSAADAFAFILPRSRCGWAATTTCLPKLSSMPDYGASGGGEAERQLEAAAATCGLSYAVIAARGSGLNAGTLITS